MRLIESPFLSRATQHCMPDAIAGLALEAAGVRGRLSYAGQTDSGSAVSKSL